MKKFILSATLVVSAFLVGFTPAATPATWTLDKSHSRLGFSISHMMLSDADGSFKKFESKITAPKGDDFTDAVVELTVDVNSVDTDDEKRDEHIKNPDFFDAAKYPTFTFKSTSFKKAKGNAYKVLGNLTMHGVTKPVELTAVAKTGVNPYTKKSVTGFKITGTIMRKDFNVGTTTPSTMLGEEVQLTANAEFVKE